MHGITLQKQVHVPGKKNFCILSHLVPPAISHQAPDIHIWKLGDMYGYVILPRKVDISDALSHLHCTLT